MRRLWLMAVVVALALSSSACVVEWDGRQYECLVDLKTNGWVCLEVPREKAPWNY